MMVVLLISDVFVVFSTIAENNIVVDFVLFLLVTVIMSVILLYCIIVDFCDEEDAFFLKIRFILKFYTFDYTFLPNKIPTKVNIPINNKTINKVTIKKGQYFRSALF